MIHKRLFYDSLNESFIKTLHNFIIQFFFYILYKHDWNYDKDIICLYVFIKLIRNKCENTVLYCYIGNEIHDKMNKNTFTLKT